MRNNFLPPALSVVFFAILSGLHGQELSFLGGAMNASSLEQNSYSWQIDYRQGIYKKFEASVAWINEGHVVGHHRDGYAFEGWTSLPLFNDKLSLSVGAGVYYFFDSKPIGADTLDIHGSAPIFSASLTGNIAGRWFWRAMVNRINPSSDIHSNTAVAGIGYWFGKGEKALPGHLPGLFEHPDNGERYVTDSEFTVFAGQSVVNIYGGFKSIASGFEYRHGLLPHVDWTFSGLYEGDPKIIRRSGIATQIWPVNTFVRDDISVGMGFGVYGFLDQKGTPRPGQRKQAAVAGLVSPTFAVQLSEHWLMRVMWDRVVSNYNRDADVFLLGFGHRWTR